MAEDHIKALIIAVGDNIEPVVQTINRYQPECLCFFAPEAIKRIVDDEIIPKIERPPKQWDQVNTPDPQDLNKCCEVLVQHLPQLVGRWSVDPSEVVVDYSGGTKIMSSALLLCAIDYASSFSYQEEGTPSGEGPQRVNPWDELAVKEQREATGCFNRGRYWEAADIFTQIKQKVSGGSKPLYKALSNLSSGYAYWDAFDYRQAWNRLQEAKKALEMATLFGGPPGLKPMVSGLKENLSFLEKIAMGTPEVRLELFLDLMSNARRRAQFENRYEDAMRRVLRALELLAQIHLNKKGIRTHAVDLGLLPEVLKNEFRTRYTSEIDGKIKIGLIASFRLLQGMRDELGEVFEKQWNSLKVLIESSDQSILGHGCVSIKPDRYQQLYGIVWKISGQQEAHLPRFPRMDL